MLSDFNGKSISNWCHLVECVNLWQSYFESLTELFSLDDQCSHHRVKICVTYFPKITVTLNTLWCANRAKFEWRKQRSRLSRPLVDPWSLYIFMLLWLCLLLLNHSQICSFLLNETMDGRWHSSNWCLTSDPVIASLTC